MTKVGRCPACERLYTLAVDGTLPNHLEKSSGGSKTAAPCGGVGAQPSTDRTIGK